MLLDMQRAPRCGAKTRRGTACQSPAMPNGRCRIHGGLVTRCAQRQPERLEARVLLSRRHCHAESYSFLAGRGARHLASNSGGLLFASLFVPVVVILARPHPFPFPTALSAKVFCASWMRCPTSVIGRKADMARTCRHVR